MNHRKISSVRSLPPIHMRLSNAEWLLMSSGDAVSNLLDVCAKTRRPAFRCGKCTFHFVSFQLLNHPDYQSFLWWWPFPPISSYLPTFLFHCLNSRNAGYEKSNVSISSQKKAIRSSNRSWRVKPTKCLCLHGMNMAVVWWWSRTRWRLEILSWKKQGRIQWIWCRIFVLALWRLSAS